jgi:hypothetical protein
LTPGPRPAPRAPRIWIGNALAFSGDMNARRTSATGLVCGVGLLLAACAAGCSSPEAPILEVRTSLNYVMTDLYARPDGFAWWDNDIEGAGHGLGKITTIGDRMVANGAGCGVYGWGICDATLTDGRIEIHLPDWYASTHPLQTFGLQRVAGAVQLDDGAGGVLLAIRLDADGNADVTGRTGVQIATTQKSDHGIQGLSAGAQPAYLGAVDSDLPADIAALALGDLLDTSGDPHIPAHALVVASAMTWLR